MSTTGDRLDRLTARMLVLLVAMVIAGFVPSIGSDSAIAGPEYREFGPPATPTQLIIPAIKLRAPLVPIQVDANSVLNPPADTTQVGWWDQSAKPGSPTGQTVMTGHTVHTGGGVLNRLHQVKKGDIIRVRTATETMFYETTKVVEYTYQEVAEHSWRLFNQERNQNRLVLITCSDFRNGVYHTNIITFATPLGVRVDPDAPNDPDDEADTPDEPPHMSTSGTLGQLYRTAN